MRQTERNKKMEELIKAINELTKVVDKRLEAIEKKTEYATNASIANNRFFMQRLVDYLGTVAGEMYNLNLSIERKEEKK